MSHGGAAVWVLHSYSALCKVKHRVGLPRSSLSPGLLGRLKPFSGSALISRAHGSKRQTKAREGSLPPVSGCCRARPATGGHARSHGFTQTVRGSRLLVLRRPRDHASGAQVRNRQKTRGAARPSPRHAVEAGPAGPDPTGPPRCAGITDLGPLAPS